MYLKLQEIQQKKKNIYFEMDKCLYNYYKDIHCTRKNVILKLS